MQRNKTDQAIKQKTPIQNNTLENDDKPMTNLLEHEERASGQKVSPEQLFNESLIKLLVLLYQIDGKVTLTEQDLFDEILVKLNWHSGVSLSAFVNDAIHQPRVAIDAEASREFLFALGNGLNFDPATALELAMDITEIDGKRSEDELELLALLSNRVLTKTFVA
jgi:hypothetical protein